MIASSADSPVLANDLATNSLDAPDAGADAVLEVEQLEQLERMDSR